MKNLRINYFLMLLFIGASTMLTSCVQDDDYADLNIVEEEPNIDGTIVDLSTVYNELVTNEYQNFTFEETNNYAEAYVVSSDEGGNFYKKLVVQDKPENPTIGFAIGIDITPAFTRYAFGQKVYIKLDGLTVGQQVDNVQYYPNTEFNEPTLGINNGSEIDDIPASQVEKHILRSSEIATIVPDMISFDDLSAENVNTFVQFSEVQFKRSLMRYDEDGNVISSITYAGEPGDEYDVERTFLSCVSNGQMPISTSAFSDFKSVSLPQGSGTLSGVLSRTYYGDNYTLFMRTPEDADMTNERCDDPNILYCGIPNDSNSIVYEENFNSATTFASIGWDNINVTGGNLSYVLTNFQGDKYAQISGFQSGETNYEVWLVSPEIDLSSTTDEDLSMRIQTNHNNGVILSMHITDNYTGDPATTEWKALDLEVPNGPSSGFGNFQDVGPTNISCAGDNVRIAFKYVGSDPDATTRYHIDDIKVTGN
ncbi:hypothetical protein CAP47_08520 [Psychroflexus sp. S27]|uniref:DUF5689 domain-containing protein n=1 Tax=Psychroflexus sp. S27 TaxID=1982757 RepID=UPI000C2AD149|nr:DUF5689 domain-containing protein [Psychroflexus sp. S27]PJX21669.1 hypothetical protein CAP47_08520 [Psychroflexus sp. S27]